MIENKTTTNETVNDLIIVDKFDLSEFKENKIIGSDVSLTKAALKADSESYSLESAMNASFAFVEQIKEIGRAHV